MVDEGEAISSSHKPGRNAFVLLGVLAVLGMLGIAGSFIFQDQTVGTLCNIFFVPALSIAIGIVANHAYSRQGLASELAKQVQNAVYTTLHLKRSVQFVDDRLAEAHQHLEAGQAYRALIEVVRAKTATELSINTAQQSSRQWQAISEAGARAAQELFGEDDDEMRPIIKPGNDPKVSAADDEGASDGTV